MKKETRYYSGDLSVWLSVDPLSVGVQGVELLTNSK